MKYKSLQKINILKYRLKSYMVKTVLKSRNLIENYKARLPCPNYEKDV